MWHPNRRDFARFAALASLSPWARAADPDPAEIYRLLGFATMTGEDPLKLWARLRDTRQWLAGPLSPDAWCGQVFVADHADIFAFRFLSLAPNWMQERDPAKQAQFCGKHYNQWLHAWPSWWKTVGPKAWDNSYARIIWQMPDGGPEVTYEWARTASNEIVCRITHSQLAAVVIGYVPWDSQPPRFSVLYADGPDRRFLHGRSWVPGTRDGMRWVLATSAPAAETERQRARSAGTDTILQLKSSTCARGRARRYASLETATSRWLEPGRIDELLERNRERYLAARVRPAADGWRMFPQPSTINWNGAKSIPRAPAPLHHREPGLVAAE